MEPAIEIKVVQGGPGMRDILGQAIAYRMHYRSVILVVIDQTPECKIVELCQDKTSQEYRLLSGLADELNIFSIVGLLGQSKNVVFSGRRRVTREGPPAAEGKGDAAAKTTPKPRDDSTPLGV